MSGDVAQLSIAIDSSQVPKATQAMDKMADSGDRLESGIKTLVGLWATWELGKYISDTALLAARYDTLGVAMHQVGQNIGYTAAEMDQLALKLQATGISMVESRQNLTRLAIAHIDLANATQLARVAQDAAVIGNVNSSQAFESMIHGIQSGQTEVLRNIGINVQFEQGYKRLAVAMGKTTSDLTDQEKAQSRANQVLEYGATLQGTYEAAMGTAGKQMKSMERYAEDLQVKLGEVFQPGLAVAVEALSDGFKSLSASMDESKGNGALKAWQDDIKGLVVNLRDGTQWLIENKNAVLLLGEAYVGVKVGSAIGSWVASTQALIAAKAQSAIAVNLERSLTLAEADAKYVAALATSKAAFADLELVTALSRENAITMSVVGGKNVYIAATERTSAALGAQLLAERELIAAQESAAAMNVARGTMGAVAGAGAVAEGAAAGSVVPGVGTLIGAGVGLAIMLMPQLIDLVSELWSEEDKAAESTKKLNGEFEKIKKPQGLDTLRESINSLNKELERYDKLQAGNGLSDRRFAIAPKAVQDEAINYKRAIDQLSAGYDHLSDRVQYLQLLLNQKPGDKGLAAQLDAAGHAMQTMAGIMAQNEAYLTQLAGKEKEREDKQKVVDAHAAEEQKAKDRAEAVKKIIESIQSENEALDRERIQLEQGAKAVYDYDLAKKGITGTAKILLQSKFDEIDAEKQLNATMKASAASDRKDSDAVGSIMTQAVENYEKLGKSAEELTKMKLLDAGATREQVDATMKWVKATSDKQAVIDKDISLDRYAAQLNQKDDYQTKLDRLNATNDGKHGLSPEAYAIALKKLGHDNSTVWGEMANSIEGFSDNGAAALASFFNGTKTGFRDMVSSLLIDIERLILKEQVVAPFLSYMTGMDWGFGGSGESVQVSTNLPVETLTPIAPLASLASGTDYVPHDGLAYIHKGEAVVPASQNGKGGGNVISINVTVNSDGTTKSTVDAGAQGKAIAKDLQNMMDAWGAKNMRSGGLFNPV